MFQDFVSKKIAIRGALCPFVILSGIRGIRPYNPSRVMRQFGRKQILPMKGDTSRYTIDYNRCDKIPHAREIFQEWARRVNLKESIVVNKYQPEYVDEYNKWLQDDLLGTLNSTPCTGRQIEDIQGARISAYGARVPTKRVWKLKGLSFRHARVSQCNDMSNAFGLEPGWSAFRSTALADF
ncbi:hypothetical protein KY285_024850 [Solanum tuberosum]|nr:hypothetical protein KY284_024849 [Solanum tuberosum]KAH0677049.1 hypothetical protein KY285_024850 [Solanum tuberosum]